MTGAASADDARMDFEVLLGGRPVGSHSFEVSRAADGTGQVRSVAAFDVKLLGIPVYRYRHQASEWWSKGCLARIESSTDDNGRKSRVARSMDGCVISYAYWDPASLLQQRRLLNPQTGEIDAIRVERLADETLTVRGTAVAAEHYRLHGDKLVIDLWYSKQGDWLQLVSTAGANRELRYRRMADGG